MAPRRTLQDVLVMRNAQQKARDLRRAKEAAVRNVLSNRSSIARHMSIESYHCRYSKHFFDKNSGKKIFPSSPENIHGFWMFHKPYMCDQNTSLDATIAPPVKTFVDWYVRKEHARGKNNEKSVRLLYELPKNYSGVVLCQWMPDQKYPKYGIGDTVPLGIEVLFHCMYPYISDYHDNLLHKFHCIDLPLHDHTDYHHKSPQAVVKIDSLGKATDSLRYWHADRRSSSNKDSHWHSRYMIVEVSVPILEGRIPCVQSLLEPLLRVDVLKYPRTMIHAAKLTAELLDDTKTVQMTSSTIRPNVNFEYNRVPSFPKFYITEKSLSELSKET